MRALILTIACLIPAILAAAAPAEAKQRHNAPNASNSGKPLALDPIFVRDDGAILSWTSGGVVDPYFPTKALLLAQDSGMNIHDIGTKWVEWLMARQKDDGLFARYCYKEDKKEYETCAPADADDALMAMWIELLYRLAPRGGLPDAWKSSADRAQYQLDSIYNPKTTVFNISKTNPVGLLMDNIEIYSAFENIARNAIRMGDNKTAIAYRQRAAQLKIGINATFWDTKANMFKASTQSLPEHKFYPDDAAQMFPVIHDFQSPYIKQPDVFYKNWIKTSRTAWFDLIGKDYPWGMLAVLAVKQGDLMTANCWAQKVTPLRNGEKWSVVDDVAYQAVDDRLRGKWPKELPPCKLDEPAKEKPKKHSKKAVKATP